MSADSAPLAALVDGEDRYVAFAERVLGIELADTQKRILREVTRHKNTVVMSGNGVGKSYAVAILCLAFLYCNPRGSVMLTSGSYQQMESTVWSEMKSLLKQAREAGFPLPGCVKEAQPRIECEEYPSKAFRAISSTHPDSLEGRHAEKMLVIVDEADKPDVGQAVIESARSSVTDGNDRFLVIGNPPRSEANSMYDLLVDDNYHTINFSSFNSHNVRVEAGLAEGDTIPGLVGLEQLEEDYELWNRGEFPGVEEAMSQVRADEEPTPGICFTYRLGYVSGAGDAVTEKLARLYATIDGEVTSERPEYVDTLSPSEVNRSQELDQLATMADDLHSVAEMRAWDEVESFAKEAREEREREVEIKREHAERHFKEQIQMWEERLEQYEAQDGPNKDMSAPIGNAKQNLDELRRERKAELSRLDEEQHVTPEEPELVTAAFAMSSIAQKYSFSRSAHTGER